MKTTISEAAAGTIIRVTKTMPAKKLLKILNDPKRAADAAKLGWDTKQARIECEKSIAAAKGGQP